MMELKSQHGTATIHLEHTIGSHLRNAGFREEVIDEIVEALEIKSELTKYKKELGLQIA